MQKPACLTWHFLMQAVSAEEMIRHLVSTGEKLSERDTGEAMCFSPSCRFCPQSIELGWPRNGGGLVVGRSPEWKPCPSVKEAAEKPQQRFTLFPAGAARPPRPEQRVTAKDPFIPLSLYPSAVRASSLQHGFLPHLQLHLPGGTGMGKQRSHPLCYACLPRCTFLFSSPWGEKIK